MRGIAMSVLLLGAALAAPVRAQDAADTSGPEAAALRQQIESRFAEQVRQQLGLTAQQAVQLRDVNRTWTVRRRDLRQNEATLRMALAGQLRPGIAAESDSVGRLLDRLMQVRADFAATYGNEMRDLARFLTPVQRAQFFLLRERLQQRVENARRETLRQLAPGGRRRF